MLSQTEGDPCTDVPRQQRSARGSLRMQPWEVALRGTGAEVPRRPLASQSRGCFTHPVLAVAVGHTVGRTVAGGYGGPGARSRAGRRGRRAPPQRLLCLVGCC